METDHTITILLRATTTTIPDLSIPDREAVGVAVVLRHREAVTEVVVDNFMKHV